MVPTCSGGGSDAGAGDAGGHDAGTGGGTTTTLSGKVLDPAGKNGLYNALVYIPNDPSDPGLQPFPAGITCDQCGSTAAGDPLVTTNTAPDGTFTLSGVPVGASIPLVIQLGRWRRQFTIPISNACGPNTIPAGTVLSMPQNHTQGDLPRIAFVTGTLDPVECLFRKIGVQDSEFSDPGGAGYFQFFLGDGLYEGSFPGKGAQISGSTPSTASLFAATGGPMNGPLINNYDMVIEECQGFPQGQTAARETALAAYAAAGGRVFASDFQYTWLFQQPSVQTAATAFPGVANWGGNHQGSPLPTTIGVIDQPPSNPVGMAFQEWLQDVGVSAVGSETVSLNPVFSNLVAVTPPTQEWIHRNVNASTSAPIQFTFNTPIGATSANQCGRVTFNDWHAEVTGGTSGQTFPNECPAGALDAQEAILEFMMFDLSACVMPYTPLCTPKTCSELGIECGPAGDGCGNLIQCPACAAGQTCGGGGSGKCGTSTSTCIPETCMSQMIQCGPAGDGCGHEIPCGNCPTGQVCGLNAPGQCGSTSK
jgi:hypothetical protein